MSDLRAATLELLDLREQRAELNLLIAEAEDNVVALMEAENAWQTELPGVGVVVRHSGKTRKGWDHDRVWSDVGRAVRECPKSCPLRRDVATGELATDTEHLQAHIRAAAGIAYWKKGGMGPLGLDLGDYSTYQAGRQTVEVVT